MKRRRARVRGVTTRRYSPRTHCDWCKSPLVQVIEPRRVAREGEFVIVDLTWLACPKACLEYEDQPFTVSNRAEENERAIDVAWVEKYGTRSLGCSPRLLSEEADEPRA